MTTSDLLKTVLKAIASHARLNSADSLGIDHDDPDTKLEVEDDEDSDQHQGRSDPNVDPDPASCFDTLTTNWDILGRYV